MSRLCVIKRIYTIPAKFATPTVFGRGYVNRCEWTTAMVHKLKLAGYRSVFEKGPEAVEYIWTEYQAWEASRQTTKPPS